MNFFYLSMLVGLFFLGCNNVEFEHSVPDCYLTKYDSEKELFNYYFVSKLPAPAPLKEGGTPRQAFQILGKNTASNYSGIALIDEQDHNVYYGSCLAFWHLYTIVDSKPRFLDVLITFHKKLDKNNTTVEGDPLNPLKDAGWFIKKIEYSYPSLQNIKNKYEKSFIQEGEYRERQKHIPAYFKMDYSSDRLYGCYKKVNKFPDTSELKAGTSAQKVFEAIGCYWNGGSTSIIHPSIEFDDGRSYDGSKNHCEILKWKLCKSDDDKLCFMDISILFLKERKAGEEKAGAPGDYFECDGWYVGGVKISYPSEVSVKEAFERNNKKYGN